MKMCKWIIIRPIIRRDGNKELLGAKIRVSEHNSNFDWYKRSPYYKIVKEFERPCTKRKCKLHKG